MAENNYAQDRDFLRKHTELIELAGDDGSAVLVTPAWQGRAMTSTLDGDQGKSFGWLNAEFIASGEEDPTFNNYGGEDRFWLGPEAGQFGLWFDQGEPFDLAHWKTPQGFNRGAFEVVGRDGSGVEMAADFEVTNYSGTTFPCNVKRRIGLLGSAAAADLLGATLPAGVSMVGFESSNTLTNAGDSPWTPAAGLLSIWILGQFKPLPRGKVIVPFVEGDEGVLGRKVTTDYFGELPPERGRFTDGHFLFTCDGQFRSKIGVSPARAKDRLGSYDPDAKVLTVVQFSLPEDPAGRKWVNSLWEMQDEPFAGDVINSYNDGEEKPGAGQLGPFYEIETSSPAADLAPGASIVHAHRTFHFSGHEDGLRALAAGVLGFDITAIG
ncbi:MAG: DUF6786 family protein [Phycisphaerae bacterium]